MTTQTMNFDTKRAEAFADRFVGALNESALMLMVSIGHRTGLFDALAELEWTDSQGLASAAGLDERYVREWLAAMVTGKVIDYRPEKRSYRLPPEHGRWLTRAASPENLAVTAQWISVLGSVESQIVERFQTGGGVGYECFHRFHETMAEESAQTVVAALHDHILPLEPTLEEALRRGIDVLDVGCGSGRALCELASSFPKSRFVGYDLCEDAVVAAQCLAAERGLLNLRFERRDLATMEETERYDLICAFDIVHDQRAPAVVLANVHAALRRGGLFLMQDIAGSSHLERNLDFPLAPFGYTISTMHCMSVSLAQDGAGLGAMWGEELAVEMLQDAGFRDVEKHRLEHDFLNVYYTMHRE